MKRVGTVNELNVHSEKSIFFVKCEYVVYLKLLLMFKIIKKYFNIPV